MNKDDKAKRLVVRTLKSPENQKIKVFLFGGHGFSGGFYSNVAQAIDDGLIDVEYDSSQGGQAEYSVTSNTILLGFWEASEASKIALILHEASHAFWDIIGRPMPVLTSEAIAYISQCQYLRIFGPTDSGRVKHHTDPLKDKVFEIAWDIAGKILAGEILTSEDESKLRQALSSHPTYKAQASGNTEYDGLKKAWYRW